MSLRQHMVLAGMLCSAAFVFPGQANAYECLASSCPRWCGTVPYGITVGSPDIGDDVSVTETRRGMDDWTTRSCTDLTNNYTGRSSGRAGAADGQSLIGWVESGWRFGSSAIGVTGPRWNGSNCIVEADMEMNGQNFTWTTGPGSGGNVNTYSIALHEGGHYYGLGHSSDRNAAMYFAYTGGIDELGSDDEAGICFLYPGSGGGPTDCTVSGCPAGQECVSGECRAVTGDGTLCSACSSNNECGGAGDFCLQYPDGVGYCATACSSGADCPGADDVCARLSTGVIQCIRAPGGRPDCSASTAPECTIDTQCEPTERCQGNTCVPRPTDLSGLGEMCADSSECNSGLCATAAGGRCSQLCDGFDPTSCPTGFYCDGEATGTCGEGLCLAGVPGVQPLGGACTVDTDCASTDCLDGVCTEPCQVGGAVTCSEGFACQTTAVAGCGACKAEASLGALGASCETGVDCQSGECARRGDETFCTQICEDAAGCPTAFSCIPAGDVSLCVADEGPERIDSGCGCAVAGAKRPVSVAWLALIPGLVLLRRRRR